MPDPRDALEALEERLSDAIENAMWAHEALKNDSICTCDVRNNMDGDVLTSHRVSEAVEAASAVLAALELTEETERVQCDRPVNECTWSYGCGHDSTRSRFVTPWGCVHE